MRVSKPRTSIGRRSTSWVALVHFHPWWAHLDEVELDRQVSKRRNARVPAVAASPTTKFRPTREEELCL